MQNWQQLYDPLDNLWLSSLIAALPILFFFFALTRLRLKGYIAGTITAALLVGLGFKPVYAAGLCLMVNTAPVAFGIMGIPMIVLFWVMAIMDGWRGVKETWPAVMVSGGSFANACAAVGLVGREADLFRFTVKHSLIFTSIVGVITSLQAWVFPWMIPDVG